MKTIQAGYTEPKSLVEEKASLQSGRHLFTTILVTALLVVGIICSLRMGKLVPTFNGEVDVAALMEDPSDYDWSNADGAAYIIVSQNLEKTNADNVCFSVVFNFRGYDTMGESFILIAALAGSLCILRIPSTAQEEEEKKKRDKEEKKRRKAERLSAVAENEKHFNEQLAAEPYKRHAFGIIVRFTANLFLPLACTFGGYIITHGDSSPGGGFQGGVLVASAVLLVFLAYGGKALGRVFATDFLHQSETFAELIYVAVGMIGVLVGLNFAANFIIDQLHIETALIMNHAVGYHVLAGVGCLLIMLLGMMNVPEDEALHVENPDMEDTVIYRGTGISDADAVKAETEEEK